ncbi:hypothetical protein [Planctomycetes bacterium SV_7m_r]
MMKCDEGYFCEVCGKDVSAIIDSDLYLRFVIGELDPEQLHLTPERHLRCNPVLAQFIEDQRFEPLIVDGPLDRRTLDAAFASQRTELVSRGYRRLHEILQQETDLDMRDYPLADVRANYLH